MVLLVGSALLRVSGASGLREYQSRRQGIPRQYYTTQWDWLIPQGRVVFRPMQVLDSRRLTGPGLLLDGPGAVLEARLAEPERGRAIAAWRQWARRLLDAVGWPDEKLATRTFADGVSLA